MIANNIKIYEVNTSDLVDVETANIYNFLEKLEEIYLDSSFIFDMSFQSLIDTLKYNGFTDSDILKLNNVLYGRFINFYYIKDLNVYLLEIGFK